MNRRLVAVIALLILAYVVPGDHVRAKVVLAADVTIDVFETITVTDDVQILPPAQVSVTETVIVTADIRVLPPATVNIGETISVADGLDVTPPAQATVTETVTVSDTVTVATFLLVLPPETIALVSQQAKLTADDAAQSDQFGRDVAIDGDTLVVGAHANDDACPNDSFCNSGSAYIYVLSGGTWTQQAKLNASDQADGDEFGRAVAVSGDTVVVGARLDDNGPTNSGSAYVFVRSGTTWTEQAKLNASNAGVANQFGGAVAIDGNTAVVGVALDDDGGGNAGAAFVFVRSGGTWTEQAKLKASDASALDGFGISVAISGGSVVVGSHQCCRVGLRLRP